MRKSIRRRVLGLTALVYLVFSAICSQASAEPSGEYATFCSPLEPTENDSENRTPRLSAVWWPSSTSKTPALLRAAYTLIKRYGQTIKFHLAVRNTREPISLRHRVTVVFANEAAVNQHKAVSNCLSSGRGFIALTDSQCCA